MAILIRPWLPRAAWGLVAGLVGAALGSGAGAQPAPAFVDLLATASPRAPQLMEADAELARARGLSDQASVRPNPTASLTVENFAGSRAYSGLGGAETTLMLGQPIELGGKRETRMAAGRAELVAAQARRSQAQVEFAHDLAVAYAEAEAAIGRRDIAAASLSLAAEDARAVRALVDAGKEAEVRALQAETAAASARAEAEAAKAAAAAALAQLTGLAGEASLFTGLAGSVLDANAPPPAQGASFDPPAVLAAQADRAAAARRAGVERARSAPDVTVSLGVRRIAVDDASALVAGMSLPLPVFDRNRGNRQAADAGVRAADARLAAARRDAEVDLRVAETQFEAAQARLGAASTGESNAHEVARLTRLGYEAGKLPLIELIAARRAETEARNRTLEARLARVRALADIARLQGREPFGSRS